MKTRHLICMCGALLTALASGHAQSTLTKITNGDIVNDVGGTFTACSWADFNNDGFLDCFVCAWNQTNILYLNNRDGTFTKMTEGPPFRDATAHLSASAADYNNDGNLGLFVAAGGFASGAQTGFLYQSYGDGTLTRVSGTGLDTVPGFFWAAAWADYDNDGLADLFVTNEGDSESNGGRNMLFHNQGNGSFSRVNVGAIVTDITASRCALWCDYDNDGLMDLVVINSKPLNNFLYRNNGNGTFTKILTNVIATDRWPSGAVHATWGDYDNDGLPDLFITGGAGTANRLYHNSGHGVFTNVISAPMLSPDIPAGASANGAAWGDYDNDGYLDLVMTFVGAPNALFHNNGDGSFTQILSGDPVHDGGAGIFTASCAWVDYDNDGFLDLFITRNTQDAFPISNLLYHNTGNSNGWLEVKLIGTVSNRSAIGAKVRVRATIGGKTFWQLREITTGGGWDVVPLVAHFGLGDATNIDVIRIEWPSGAVQELHDQAPRRILTITEPPQLMISGALPAGSLQVSVIGAVGFSYEVQTSKDLSTWTPWTTITNTSRTMTITDTSVTNPSARFYRALAR
jgi:enediyne biosynthesis protein E4